MKRRKKNCQTDIPYHEIESLARCLLPDIQEYFESEDGKGEFTEWKQGRLKQKKAQVAIPRFYKLEIRHDYKLFLMYQLSLMSLHFQHCLTLELNC